MNQEKENSPVSSFKYSPIFCAHIWISNSSSLFLSPSLPFVFFFFFVAWFSFHKRSSNAILMSKWKRYWLESSESNMYHGVVVHETFVSVFKEISANGFSHFISPVKQTAAVANVNLPRCHAEENSSSIFSILFRFYITLRSTSCVRWHCGWGTVETKKKKKKQQKKRQQKKKKLARGARQESETK